MATQISRGQARKEDLQTINTETATILAKLGKEIGQRVYRLDFAMIEMLLWLNESTDLDEKQESLMGMLG